MSKLLSLLGLDAYLRRLRIAAGEGALAAEDRVQLLRMAWEEERQRLRLVLLFVIAVIGLTTVVVALLSVAVVVHFWDTPYRSAAAWSVAVGWGVLWLGAMIGLLIVLRGSTASTTAARSALERDWRWMQAQIGVRERGPGHREHRPATREELLARIERQRERIAQLQTAPPVPVQPGAAAGAPRRDSSLSAVAMQIAREHPVATAAAVAGVIAVAKPRRIVRFVAWAAPILWKMR